MASWLSNEHISTLAATVVEPPALMDWAAPLFLNVRR
jgi:hypothetical protein